jgi:NADH-quinone oxidoreductase subunit C
LVEALGAGTASVSGGGRWARATVDVEPAHWVEAVTTARDALGCDFFDWLSAVDELDQGYAIVAHVWSTERRHGVLLRTRVPNDAATLATIVDIYPGAAWHERETHEMFGVDFPGHPNLAPLLLPPEFEGHPLRKDFVLATRVAMDWPGAKEPRESHVEGTAKRAPMRPPGVPAPGEWGPD